jgi:hypothetical protein
VSESSGLPEPSSQDRAPAPPRRRRWLALVVVAAVVALVVALVLRHWPGPTTSSPPTTYTILGDAVPVAATAADERSVELGLRFRTAVDGWITAIRFYQGPQNSGQHDGTLWASTGEQLARTSFPESDGTGWQEARLDTPVRAQSGTAYTVSYRAPHGHYAADPQSLSPSKPVTTQALTALQGVYTYDDGEPTSSVQDMNYYVDVVFTTVPPAGALGAGSPFAAPASPTTPATDPLPGSRKPGPSNTGVPPGTTLTPYTGPMTITTAGTVIDSKDVHGALVIEAKDVVIRSSKIHDDPDADAGVYVQATGSATITDSEIYGFPVGITYANFTAIRVNLHDLTYDGLKMSSNARLQDSWIHDARPSTDAHWDGVQIQNGVTDTVISGNTIDARGAGTNSALFLTPDLGPSTDGPLTVTHNWLEGGNFTVCILDGNNKRYYISDITVTDNRFGRGSSYGPANVNVPVTWSGNVWADTGEPVKH